MKGVNMHVLYDLWTGIDEFGRLGLSFRQEWLAQAR